MVACTTCDEPDASAVHCDSTQHALCATCARNCIANVTAASRLVQSRPPYAFAFPCEGHACAFTTDAFLQSSTRELREAFLHAHAAVAVAHAQPPRRAHASDTHAAFVRFWRPDVTTPDELREWVEAHRVVTRVIEALCVRCPVCDAVFDTFDGCNALTCARCSAAFCAICAQPCGLDAHAHVVDYHKELFTRTAERRTVHARNLKVLQLMRVLREELRHPVLVWQTLQCAHRDARDNDIVLADLCVHQRLSAYAFDSVHDAEASARFVRAAALGVPDVSGVLMLLPVAPALEGADNAFLDAMESPRALEYSVDVMQCACAVLGIEGAPLRLWRPEQWLRLARALETLVLDSDVRHGALVLTFVRFFVAWRAAVCNNEYGAIAQVAAPLLAQLRACFVHARHADARKHIFVDALPRVTFDEGAAFAEALWHGVAPDAAFLHHVAGCMMQALVCGVCERTPLHLSLLVIGRGTYNSVVSVWSAADAAHVCDDVLARTKRVSDADVCRGMAWLVAHALSARGDARSTVPHDAVARVTRRLQNALRFDMEFFLRTCARVAPYAVLSACSGGRGVDALESVAMATRVAGCAPLRAADATMSDAWALDVALLVAARAPDALAVREDGSDPVLGFVRLMGDMPGHEDVAVDLFLAQTHDTRCFSAWTCTLFEYMLPLRTPPQLFDHPCGAFPLEHILERARSVIFGAVDSPLAESECVLFARYLYVVASAVGDAYTHVVSAHGRELAYQLAEFMWHLVVQILHAAPPEDGIDDRVMTLLHGVAATRALAHGVECAPVGVQLCDRVAGVLQKLRIEERALFLCVAGRMGALHASAWTHVCALLEAVTIDPAVSQLRGDSHARVLCALEAAQRIDTPGTDDVMVRVACAVLRVASAGMWSAHRAFARAVHVRCLHLLAKLPRVDAPVPNVLLKPPDAEDAAWFAAHVGADAHAGVVLFVRAVGAMLPERGAFPSWCHSARLCDWIASSAFGAAFSGGADTHVRALADRLYDGAWRQNMPPEMRADAWKALACDGAAAALVAWSTENAASGLLEALHNAVPPMTLARAVAFAVAYAPCGETRPWLPTRVERLMRACAGVLWEPDLASLQQSVVTPLGRAVAHAVAARDASLVKALVAPLVRVVLLNAQPRRPLRVFDEADEAAVAAADLPADVRALLMRVSCKVVPLYGVMRARDAGEEKEESAHKRVRA